MKYYVGVDELSTEANVNAKGAVHQFEIPTSVAPKTRMKVTLTFESDSGETIENEYNMVVGA